MSPQPRVGVFIDAENIRYNGGYQMRYDVLRRFAAREGGRLQRLNTYIAYDIERADKDGDEDYKRKCHEYHQLIREFGYKVNLKHVRHYRDEDGNITNSKADADLDLAVDAMLQAERLDHILLVTGDGDFLPLVRALQNQGCRVELIGFKHISEELQQQVDAFYSGFTIPDLLPIHYEKDNQWGEAGSCVRGVCVNWLKDKGYGFMRVLNRISADLWVTDTRNPQSPYSSVFFHKSEVDHGIEDRHLMSRDFVFEFYLQPSEQKDGLIATNIRDAYKVNQDHKNK
ncbi:MULTISPECIES: NYN domain-containing protein [Marichromatium]|uniref:Uncharacterized LabA/DUF88 family protein n=1 Tax=Marichromatium gracile TaxID=1048 RepID=A0A4R4AH99_MARGR|nr:MULTISPECIES: NYN domain-containing protein [Marichromatium]MBO8087186.1 NYN domain-containing protein [Marichromatium sp.]MBK1710145.1 NYN domain-containing protein [Marichromatium gracile]RNE89128.1 NYN domain-containing protein [Marichromatium sp. AB31]RNE92407.1 NYN domain-containing protein [Marichromatium sp. AB32]TCW38129.1 uncharacterized LabA/DUF88 family protein [Marichromatium gracile]